MRLKAVLTMSVLTILTMGLSTRAEEVAAPPATKAKHTIRWLLAHEPARVFLRAAKQFKEEIERETKGEIAVEVLTVSEYLAKYKTPDSYKKGRLLDDVALLRDGRIEMTQTYTTELGHLNPKLWVLDLPFLFRSHEHAKTVLDGEIGKGILAGLDKNNVHGLAFTYSGGYRVLASKDRPINSVESIKGLTVRISRSPVAKATFETLGAKVVGMDHDLAIQNIGSQNGITAAETTFARYDDNTKKMAPILNDTQHSLFLTSMVVNKSFFDALPANLQKAIATATKNAAVTERSDSLADEADLRKNYGVQGLQLVSMPEVEKEKMKKLVAPVYKKFTPMFGAGLIADIQKAQ